MKKKETAPDVWIAHRKERKKLASAKWYAKKKKKEIQSQRRKRAILHEKFIKEQEKPIWTRTQYCEWRSVLAYHVHMWPVRPMDIPAEDWCSLLDLAQEAMQRVHIHANENNEADHDAAFLCKRVAVQQMCMRELVSHYRTNGGLVSVTRDRVHSTSISECNTAHCSSWERVSQRLSGGWFPVTCTRIGMVFIHLFLTGQVQRWSAICRSLYQQYQPDATNRTTSVQTHAPMPPHNSPPDQNPTMNERIQRILTELQQEEEKCEDDNSNDSVTSFFSCSTIPSSLDHDGNSECISDDRAHQELEETNSSNQSSWETCSIGSDS